MVPPRIELGYQVPETCVLSIVLRDLNFSCKCTGMLIIIYSKPVLSLNLWIGLNFKINRNSIAKRKTAATNIKVFPVNRKATLENKACTL